MPLCGMTAEEGPGPVNRSALDGIHPLRLRNRHGAVSRHGTMPLQRIDLTTSRSPEVRSRIADAVHRALVEAISVPVDDRFQVMTAHPAGELFFAPSYLDIPHKDPVLVQVTLSRGRTTEQKQALFRRMGELVEAAGVPRNELVVSLVESGREDWSFGDGIAQYVPEK
jgi:4-oxalocrotonate tautomerase